MKIFTRIALSAILMVSLTGCGLESRYRYSCQDPANWEKEECVPPACEASGVCSKDLVKQTNTTQNGTTNG